MTYLEKLASESKTELTDFQLKALGLEYKTFNDYVMDKYSGEVKK